MNRNLGATFTDLGQAEAAAACYRNEIARHPEDIEAIVSLGAVLQSTGKPEKPSRPFARPLTWTAQHRGANQSRQCPEAAGTPRRGGRLLQEGARGRPVSAAAQYNLAVAFQEAGQWDDAAASYRRVLEINPKVAEAHANLGNVLRGLGRSTKPSRVSVARSKSNPAMPSRTTTSATHCVKPVNSTRPWRTTSVQSIATRSCRSVLRTRECVQGARTAARPYKAIVMPSPPAPSSPKPTTTWPIPFPRSPASRSPSRAIGGRSSTSRISRTHITTWATRWHGSTSWRRQSPTTMRR